MARMQPLPRVPFLATPFVILLTLLAPLPAEDIVVVQDFAPEAVQVTPVDGGQLVSLQDGQRGLMPIGHPDLPVRSINVAIPRGARGVRVSAEIQEQAIGQGVVVLPCQPQSPPDQPVVRVPPDPQAYALDARAPVDPAVITGTHSMRGRSFVSLQLSPVRYNAARRELFLITRMTIRLEVERAQPDQAQAPGKALGKIQAPGKAQGKVGDRPRPQRGNEEFDRMFKGMVVNPGFDDEAPAPAPAPAPEKQLPPPVQAPLGEVPTAGEQWYVYASPASVNENAGTATFTVYCTVSVTGTIDYATANATASAGSDYTATSGTLSFANQNRLTVTVPILDDVAPEGNETFTFSISNPSLGTLYAGLSTATTTIVDNENPGTLKFAATDLAAGETATSLLATVSRTGGSFGAVTVNYATQNGNALAGTDYTSTSGTLSWASGDTADKTITVPLLDDALAEGSEIFYLNLSAATGGATLGPPTSATATIVDDEANPNAADYLIITNDALKPTFQVLADHRANHNGFVAKVVTVSYILASYPGADDQQKIRNFIKACVTDSGTQYVVLGGDSTVVKDRDCYVSCGSYEEPNMPTDLYYAGLDGTWNSDGDGTYGEAGQDTDVDLAIDVMVGRIPVQTAGQAAAYIAKVLAYDGTPPLAIARKMMIGGVRLWDSYSATSYNGGEGRPSDDVTGDGHRAFRDAAHPTVSDGEMWMRRSYRNYVQAFGWQPSRFSIMYDTLTSWDGAGTSGSYAASGPNVATRLSEDGGYNFLLVYTHGGNNVWAFEGPYFGTSEAAGLTGAANFVYTDACLTGGFDAGEPCLSEAMLRCPTGGSLVYLGCSRYGWGGPDANPADTYTDGGSSAYCMNLWLDEVFNKKNLDCGVAFFNHKARFASYCSYNGSYRWIQFGLNFQGDPALKIIGVQPFVSVSAATTAKGEGEGGTVAITFRRCGAAVDSDLTVNYTRSGTAASGADYTTSPALASSGSITIPAGADAATVNLTVLNDTLVEGDESVTVAVAAGTGYLADSLSSTTVTIIDNDNAVVPTVQLAVVDSVAREQGPDPGVIRVWRTGGCGTAITVPLAIAGTAGNGVDYQPLPASVTLAANVAAVDILVTPIDDMVGDIGETVVLGAQAGAGYVLGASTSGTLTIEDNDMTVTVAAQDANASEPGRADGNGNFRFSRSGAITLPATIHYTVSGTAGAGDYAALAGTVSFAAHQTSVDVSLVPADDSSSEARESVIVTLIPDPVVPTAYSIGTPGAATVYIHDDDLPVVAVETSANTFAEPDGSKTAWTLRRIKGNQNTAISVNYTLGGVAVAGTDYGSLPGTATIAANSTAETTAVNLALDPTQDAVCEGPETAIVTLAADAAYAIEAGAASGTITINDDDKPTVAVTATALISEGSTGTVTITRSNDLVLDQVTVLYTVTGTATALADYAALSGSLIIPQHEASASFTVSALADSIPEPGETLIVTISANAAYTVATAPGNAATATIIDDDETPLVTVTASDATSSEPGRADGPGVLRFQRAGDRSAAISVGYLVGGSATAGTDYQALAGSVTIPAGSDVIDVAVTPLDDSEAEADENVVVTLLPGAGYQVGAPVAATVNLYDDETPQVFVTVSDPTCKEAATADPGVFRINRLGNRGPALSIVHALSGTALNGTDYAAVGSPFTLAANSTAGSLTITPTNDALVEGSETVALTLAAGGGYTLAAPSSAMLYIQDDETVDVSLSVPDGIAIEGISDKGTFRITRSATAPTSLTVLYTVAGTATPGTDYASLSGTATIPANATTVDITVDASAFNDGLSEGAESVVVALDFNNGVNLYDITSGPATVLVRDDETPTITLAATDGSASEEGDTGTFTVTAAPAPTANLTVNLTCGGTASAGSDYQALPASVVILAGQTTATLTVTPYEDDLYEGTGESVQLTLAAGAYNVGTTTAQTVTISDAGDKPVVTAVAIDASATEAGPTTGKFLLVASKAASASYAVNFTVSGSASSGSDYASIGTSKTIAANAFQTDILVTPVNDALAEGPESVVLTLGSSTAYAIGSPAVATVTIADDDASSPGTLAFSSATFSQSEGDSGSTPVTITVSRSGGSTGAVSVAYATAGGTATAGSDYTATSGTLSWADGEAGDKTFSVSVLGDYRDESNETVALTLGSPTGGASLGTAAATLTIVDDDTAGVAIGTISGQTTENGGTATFTVALASQPTATVTIGLSSSDPGEGTVSPASLSFTTGNWNVAQTVTVTGIDDAVADGAISFSVVTAAASSADGAYNGLNAADVAVVNADDVVALTVTAGAGGTVSPNGTVQADPDGPTAVVATPAAGYSFVNWTGNTAGMASTTAASTTIQPTAAQAIQANFVANVVTIVASPTAVPVPEGGTATFQVQLSAQPTASVTVAVARASGDTDLTVSAGASLVFTTTDWNTAKTVTLAAAADADTTDGVALFDCTATGLATVTVTATEEDDDTALLTLAIVPGSISEAGGTATATVTRVGGTTGALTVNLASSDTTEATVPASVTLADGVASTTCTVSAVDDALVDGTQTVTITATAAGLSPGSATVAVTDDDVAGITVGAISGQTTENGGTATFTVVLRSQPTAGVTIVLSSSDASEGTVSPASLAFTVGNWNVAQAVTVTGVDDAVADGPVAYTVVTAAASSADAAYNGLNAADVAVVNADDAVALTVTAGTGGTVSPSGTMQADPDGLTAVVATPAGGYLFVDWTGDTAGMASTTAASTTIQPTVAQAIQANFVLNAVSILASTATVSVPEGGTAGFQVRLSAAPAATVTVAVARASGDSDITVTGGASLVFTTANWNTPQAVQLSAAEDDGDQAAGTATIACAAAGLATATVTANEVDDERALTITAVNGTVGRAPATPWYDHGSSVELTAVPATGYHFTGWSGALGGSANPATLVMDADKAVTANFALNLVAIEAAPATVGVPEGGSATFQVRLSAQPVANVTIALAKVGGDADLTIASAPSLLFTTVNWGTWQTVTLTAAEDDADQAAGSATFSCTAAGLTTVTVTANEVDDDHVLTRIASNGSIAAAPATALYDHGSSVTLTAVADAGYHFTGWSGALTGSVNPTTLVMDADKSVTASFAANVVAVEIDATLVSVPEGGTAGFQVRLSAQPAANVTVNVGRTAGDSDLSVAAGAVLTFTTANWQTWQGVTLAAAEDADVVNGTATMTCSGGACGSPTVQAVEADNDEVNLIVDSAVVAVPEGGTAGFRVRLSQLPAADVVVTVARTAGDGDITVGGGASLTFTTANWATWQDVTLAAAEDDADMLAGAATISGSAAGVDTVTVSANEVDDDHALTITAVNGTVAKLPASAYHDHGSSVELTASPDAGFHFIGWSGALGGSANPANLTMDADKAVTAHFAANDVAILVAASVVVPENGTASLAVQLSAQPSGPVTVAVSASGDPDVVVQAGASLVFDSLDWNVGQTVTLAALDDADALDGGATITCAAAGLASVTVAATEDDDDVAALTLTLAQSTVGEAAGLVSATVSRNTATSGALLVSLGSSLPAQATVPASVTIPAGASSASFSITVIDDLVVDGTQTTLISTTASGHAAASASLQITDNDSAGFVVAPTSLHVAEAGGTATFTVVLAARPQGDVRLLLSSSAPGEATVAPAVLLITPATWDTPRTVTVTGVDDAVFGAGSATIAIAIDDAASDDAFDALADQQVAVTCDDDEINLAPTIAVVSPVGAVAVIPDGLGLRIDTTVADDGLPGAPAVLAISWSQVGGPGSATFDCLSCEDVRVGFSGPGVYVLRLSATDGLLTTTRDFTITVDNGGGPYANLAPLVSAGPDAAGAVGSPIALAGSASDDGSPSGTLTLSWSQVLGSGVAVFSAPSSATTNVTCPLPGTYVFRLTADDGAVRTCDEVQVTVAATYLLTVHNDGHCTTVPAGTSVRTTGVAVPISATPASSYHFTGWVVVSGPAIFADWLDASTTVTATADAVIRASCAINTYTLAYNAAAGGSVSGSALQTVAHGGSGTAVTAVPSAGYHFTGWSDGVVGATRSDGPVTANLAVSAGFAANMVAILSEAGAIAVTENGGRTLGVRLSAQPTGNVTVNVAHAAGDADLIVVSGAALTFTTADWNVPQTVILGALDDADLVNGTAQISLSATGLATVLVTAVERDDDAPQSIGIGSSNPGGGGCGAGGLGLLLACALFGLSLHRRVRAEGR